jgi:hypothetical protein
MIAALTAATMACRAAPGPGLESINPGVVFDDESVQLAIRGTFQPPVKANLDRPDASTFDRYEVELSAGGRVVKSVSATFQDARTLQALLPAGMPRATYRVRVIDPWGKDSALENALVVAGRAADGGYLYADGGGTRIPPLPDIYVAPTFGDVTTVFAFDAGGSTDTTTPVDRLEVSWGFSTIDGGIEWTPWMLDKGYSSQLPAGQEAVLLRARDEDGDVGYAGRRIFVAADPTSVCTVTTARDEDDGALDCSGGADGQLSLDEAVRLAPVLKFQVVGFDIPGPAALTGSPLQITEPIRLAGSPNITLQRELVIKSQGKVRITGLNVAGPAGKITITDGSKLDLSDCAFSDAEPIRATGAVSVRRTAFRNCQTQCIVLTGGDGTVQVSESSFIGGPASAVGIELDQCPVLVTVAPAADLVGNVFAGFNTAVFVNNGCERPTSIVHQTFHGNTVAIMYQGGAQHVLRNNVFSAHTEPVMGCGLFDGFAARQDNVVWENTFNDCLASDPGVLQADPKFASPDGGDFRLRWESPLIDAAPVVLLDGGTLDVNGAVPGNYLGNGPDYGGRETY